MKAIKSICVAAVLALGALSSAALELDGSKFVILCDYMTAGKELQEILSAVTGQKVPLYTTAQAAKLDLSGKYPWRVGSMTEKLGKEECEWRIGETEANIWGGANHGEQWGVYDCVEEGLGVRFPWAGAISCDVGTKVKVLKTEGAWKNPYRIRACRMRGVKESTWRWRMRDGKHDHPGYGHAFYKFWERFGCNKLHPEYFAMRTDGKRMPIGWGEDTAYNAAASDQKPSRYISMCVSSEAFVDQVVSDWTNSWGSVAENARGAWKTPQYINLCENDASGGNVCHCPACKALDEPRPANSADWWPNWYTDRYVNFAYRVLAKARKFNPACQAVMYAYNATEIPPIRERINGDIIVGMVPTIFTKKAVHDFVQGWKDKGVKEFFHRPNRRCYYSPRMLPVNFSKHFFEILQDLTRFDGFIGADWDGSAQPLGVNWIADYVVMKCLQDPTKDYEFWEDHYMDAFGSAKEDIRAYYRYWRKLWDERLEAAIPELTEKGRYFNFMRGLIWNVDRYYTYEDFAKSGVFLKRAAARKDLNPLRRALVDRLLSEHEYSEAWIRAVVDKCEDNTNAFVAYCERNGKENLSPFDKYSGDICGVWRNSPNRWGNVWWEPEGVVIVDLGHPRATAELKLHLDYLLDADIPVVKTEAEVREGQHALYVGRQPHNEDPRVVDTLTPEQGHWKHPKSGPDKGRGYFYAATEDALENAVWDFLEFEMGVRWPWGDEIAAKKHDHLNCYSWKNAWGPDVGLVNHWVRFENEPKSEIFARRLRCGSHKPTGKEKVIEFRLGEGLTLGSEKAAFDKLDAFLTANRHKDVSVVATFPKPENVLDWHVAYILAKQLLEPFKSFGFWENHYLQSYGAAAREMREAFKVLRAGYAAKGAVDADDRAAAAKFVDKALARTDLLPDDRTRVEKARQALVGK